MQQKGGAGKLVGGIILSFFGGLNTLIAFVCLIILFFPSFFRGFEKKMYLCNAISDRVAVTEPETSTKSFSLESGGRGCRGGTAVLKE